MSLLLRLMALSFLLLYSLESQGKSPAAVQAPDPGPFIQMAKSLNAQAGEELSIRQRIEVAIVAEDYPTATRLIRQYHDESELVNPWVTDLFTFQYRTLVTALRHSAGSRLDFEAAFRQSFGRFLSAFDPQYLSYIGDYYQVDPDSLLRRLNTSQDAADINSISSYFRWLMLSKTKALAEEMLATELASHVRQLPRQYIQLADGNQLEVNVFLPNNGRQRHPAVLVYNLYAKGWSIDNKAQEAAAKGYAGVLVYPRGKGESSGEVAPFLTEAEDGYAIIDWISRQSWSERKVAMLGGSYLGFAQWAVTKKLHPALKTIVPSAAVVPGFNDNLTQGHVLSAEALPWYHLVTNNKTMDFGTYYDPAWGDFYTRFYRQGTPYEEIQSLWPTANPAFAHWLAHQDKPAYWRQFIPEAAEFRQLNIPVLATTGYYDHAQAGTWYYRRQHLQHNPQAEHYVVIGPFDHLGANGMPGRNLQGLELDEVAQININQLIFDWFDHVLRGAAKPALLKDKLNFQVMGANRWAHTASLTPAVYMTFNLLAGPQGNSLAINPGTSGEGHVLQTMDFGQREQQSRPASSPVLSASLAEDGALIFTSAPLTREVVMAGGFPGSCRSVSTSRTWIWEPPFMNVRQTAV